MHLTVVRSFIVYILNLTSDSLTTPKTVEMLAVKQRSNCSCLIKMDLIFN